MAPEFNFGFSGVLRVTNANNAGPGSFRQAIEDANADPSIRRVVFVAGIEYEEDNDFAGGGDIIATLTNIKIKGNG